MSRPHLPKYEGHTVGVYRCRLQANFLARSKCSDPDKMAKLEATARRYSEIIAELEKRAPARLPKPVINKGTPRHVAMRQRAAPKKPMAKLAAPAPHTFETPYGPAVEIGGQLHISTPAVIPRWRAWCERRRADYLIPHWLYGYEYIGPVIAD